MYICDCTVDLTACDLSAVLTQNVSSFRR